jgi:cell division protein FtsZ
MYNNSEFGNISLTTKNQSNVVKVIGVGGGVRINHMFKQGIKGVDQRNTDSCKHFQNSPVPIKFS